MLLVHQKFGIWHFLPNTQIWCHILTSWLLLVPQQFSRTVCSFPSLNHLPSSHKQKICILYFSSKILFHFPSHPFASSCCFLFSPFLYPNFFFFCYLLCLYFSYSSVSPRGNCFVCSFSSFNQFVLIKHVHLTVSADNTPKVRGPQVSLNAQRQMVGNRCWAQFLKRQCLLIFSFCIFEGFGFSHYYKQNTCLIILNKEFSFVIEWFLDFSFLFLVFFCYCSLLGSLREVAHIHPQSRRGQQPALPSFLLDTWFKCGKYKAHTGLLPCVLLGQCQCQKPFIHHRCCKTSPTPTFLWIAGGGKFGNTRIHTSSSNEGWHLLYKETKAHNMGFVQHIWC